jgi:hypothetical protein
MFWDPIGIIGTHTNHKNVMSGSTVTYQQYAQLSYDPTDEWTGVSNENSWKESFGGILTKALTNSIRANKHVTEAEVIKMVMALLAYSQMFRATMRYYAWFTVNYTNPCKKMVSEILGSSGGSPIFSSKDELMSDLIKNYQEHVTPWPLMAFWADRPWVKCLSFQMPWFKYLLMVPWNASTDVYDMARVFDGYVSTTQSFHPETYLRAQGLWNKFRDNILPLLWGKQTYTSYIGTDFRKFLYDIGYSPLAWDKQEINFHLHGFMLHPFNETLGVGERKLMKRAFDDITYTLEQWWWDSDGKGVDKILPADLFLVKNANKPDGVCRSPLLDPIIMNETMLYNYSANDTQTSGPVLTGGMSSDYTISDLAYDEFFILCPWHAIEFQKMELVEPEPDISYQQSMAQLTRGESIVDIMKYLNFPDMIPCRLPDRHWYLDGRNLYKYGCAILNIRPDDIELYKVQRERTEASANTQRMS